MKLSEHGFSGDELRALLQKSLRRKDRLNTQLAAKELLLNAKKLGSKNNQSWIMSYLFEDHCFVGTKTIQRFYDLLSSKKQGPDNKLKCIETMLNHCHTSNLSTLFQLASMDGMYEPEGLELDGEDTYEPYFDKVDGDVKHYKLLPMISKAWKLRDVTKLLTLLKLYSTTKAHLSEEGQDFVESVSKNTPPECLLMKVLHDSTQDPEDKAYLRTLQVVASNPSLCPRVISFVPLVRMVFGKQHYFEINQWDTEDWKECDGVLQEIPRWAIDPSVYRTKKLRESKLKDDNRSGPEAMFDDGDVFEDWTGPDTGEDVLVWQLKDMAKHVRSEHDFHNSLSELTYIYVQRMKSRYPQLFFEKKKGKRSAEEEEAPRPPPPQKSKKMKKETDRSVLKDLVGKEVSLHGPLLQCPPVKHYVALDLENNRVVKGPMGPEKIAMSLFKTKAMQLFGDTLTVDCVRLESNYLSMPVVHGFPVESIDLHKIQPSTNRLNKDPVSQIENWDVRVVNRAQLNLETLEELDKVRLKSLSYEVIGHLLLRYVLDIGDTMPRNILLSKTGEEAFGLDLDEVRMPEKGEKLSLAEMLFSTKRVSKKITDHLSERFSESKNLLRPMFNVTVDTMKDELKKLAEEYQVCFDANLFELRMLEIDRLLRE